MIVHILSVGGKKKAFLFLSFALGTESRLDLPLQWKLRTDIPSPAWLCMALKSAHTWKSNYEKKRARLAAASEFPLKADVRRKLKLVVLELQCALKPLEVDGWPIPRVSDSQGLRICICNQFPWRYCCCWFGDLS